MSSHAKIFVSFKCPSAIRAQLLRHISSLSALRIRHFIYYDSSITAPDLTDPSSFPLERCSYTSGMRSIRIRYTDGIAPCLELARTDYPDM
ncbi:uncharacterized protein ARMOST_20690 [Armillaria ostoyae]|uniref:Uncharacterized protein n=1 Tax=Armillaria ostoyae TaxID=47428 RepID=A0A284S852_ARMOS|nr:uncharacterized protein ARMOST_20690 [Armillaria ostoyae]